MTDQTRKEFEDWWTAFPLGEFETIHAGHVEKAWQAAHDRYVGSGATYFAIVEGPHIQFDKRNGLLEIYETEEHANEVLNQVGSAELEVIAVSVSRIKTQQVKP